MNGSWHCFLVQSSFTHLSTVCKHASVNGILVLQSHSTKSRSFEHDISQIGTFLNPVSLSDKVKLESID